MKKFFFLAIGLLIAGSVSAQYYSPRRSYNYNTNTNVYDFYQPRVGIDVGVNVSNTVNAYNSSYNTGTLAGLHAGLTFDIPLIYPLSFAPEVIYSQKGYTAETSSGNFTQRTQFIDLPLLAKFNLGPVVRLYIGPQYSFLLSTQNTYDNGFAVTNQQYYNNSGSKAILDGVLGVSFELNRYVDLRARYTIDMQSTTSVNSAYQPDYRNQVWQFGLGFKF